MFRFDLAPFDGEPGRSRIHVQGISRFRQVHPPFHLVPVAIVTRNLVMTPQRGYHLFRPAIAAAGQ